MKAVLVIDVEEKDIGRRVNYVSVQGDGYSYIVGTMGMGVQLRPLPKKKIVLEHHIGGYTVNGIEMAEAHSWNACLDAIAGESI